MLSEKEAKERRSEPIDSKVQSDVCEERKGERQKGREEVCIASPPRRSRRVLIDTSMLTQRTLPGLTVATDSPWVNEAMTSESARTRGYGEGRMAFASLEGLAGFASQGAGTRVTSTRFASALASLFLSSSVIAILARHR